MQNALALIPKFDPAQLKFFAKKISASIELPLASIFPPDKLKFYEEELGLTYSDLRVLEDFTKYIYTLAAGNKSFDPAREVMEKIGMDEERYKIFEGVFQDNAQGIVDAVKRKIPATDGLVDNFGFRIVLPVVQSEKPTNQEFTFNEKVKFSYSRDVRNPLASLTFNMKRDDSDTRPSAVKLDLEKSQLIQLFEETEKIKEHLDRIYGN